MTDLPHPLDLEADRYLITKFIPAIRETFTKGGYTAKHNEREEGGEFLVAIRGRLFVVQDDFSVVEPDCGYASVGAGEVIAMASLATTANVGDLAAFDRVRTALEVTANQNAFVAGPFHYEELRP